jgi:uncharacterized protein YneF (UPF0154 family)
MFNGFVYIIVSVVLLAVILIGLFFSIKYLVRYNAKVKIEKTKQQEELHKMNIKDL